MPRQRIKSNSLMVCNVEYSCQGVSITRQAFPRISGCAMCSLHLNGHCYGPATAQAECGEASATATAVQFIDEGGQDTGAAGADGVTKRNCSAVDVYARPIPVKLFAVCQGLRGKGFVDFDQVKIAELEARTFK